MLNLVILLLTFIAPFCLSQEGQTVDFDFYVFAQLWPMSDCIEWSERSAKNTCNLPSNPKDDDDGRRNLMFTVHGLWPSKFDSHHPDPVDCGGKALFDPAKVKPILSELEANWTNVHANSDEFGFWKHEWDKHGRCSPFDEREYFGKGLDLHRKWDVMTYLAGSGIKPSNESLYSFRDIFDSVRGAVGKNPSVKCDYNDEEGVFLSQINVCVDKDNLDEPIDCDRALGGLNQGCPKHESLKLIHFPSPIRKEKAKRSSLWVGFGLFFLSCFIGAAVFYFYRKRLSRDGSAYERI